MAKENYEEMYNYLYSLSQKYSKLASDTDLLYSELSNLPADLIDKAIEISKPQRDFKIVNFLRYLVANEIKNKNKIDNKRVEELKKYILNKDIENLKGLATTKELNMLKNNSDIHGKEFSKWKEPWRYFYRFFYNREVHSRVIEYLEKLSNGIMSELHIEGYKKIDKGNFHGPRNQGSSSCWIGIYPNEFKTHTNAVQFFIGFKDTVRAGINVGDELEKMDKYKSLVNLNEVATFEQALKILGQNKERIFNYNKQLLKSSDIVIINPDNKSSENKNKDNNSAVLNRILYGPPGTGKTYHTINKALEIVENKSQDQLDKEDRKDLKNRYDNYVKEGQIVFTTFHQSYGYEEFVEGIKAIPYGEEGNNDETNESKEMIYKPMPGLFKKLVDSTKTLKIEDEEFSKIAFSKANYFKVSLGTKKRSDIHEWCLGNDMIALEWGGDKDLSSLTRYARLDKNGKDMWKKYKSEFAKIYKGDKNVTDSSFNARLSYWFQRINVNDIIFVSKENLFLNAIGIVTGDYEYRDDILEVPNVYHYKKVKWLLTDIDLKPENFISKGFSPLGIYEIKSEDLKYDNIKSLFSGDVKDKNYVLIIDEINRGNISKIFGELITLIEESKRIGNPEALKVKLPYSNYNFGVPNNLYIIGTMNTADRSIALMDTALRRRFQFEEMMPNLALLSKDENTVVKDFNSEKDQENEDLFVGEINIRRMLKKINERIEYLYDRDHTIGHSYFLDLKKEEYKNDSNKAKEKIDDIFKTNIIPLLQEYFYDDWEKISLVLADNQTEKKEDKFINMDPKDPKILFGDNNEPDMETKNIFSINMKEFTLEAYKKIYK